MNALRVRLFTKRGCFLCDKAKAVLEQAHVKMPFSLEEVDIEAPQNLSWHEKYRYDIPVIHLNEKEIFRHRLKEEDLLSVLRKET